MWQRLAKAFNKTLNGVVKSKIVSAILKALGISGGFFGWIATQVATFFVGKATEKIGEEAESQGRQADRKASDTIVLEEHKQKLKEDASEEDLVKSELDILNPRRGR